MFEILLHCPCCDELWGCMTYEFGKGDDEKIIKDLSKCELPCKIKQKGACPKLNGTGVEKMKCEHCYNKLGNIPN